MSDAKKCDRCGELFDPLIQPEFMAKFVNPVFQDCNDILANKVDHRLLDLKFGGSSKADAVVDLCPGCTEEFESFMLGLDGEAAVRLARKDEEISCLERENTELQHLVKNLRSYIEKLQRKELKNGRDSEN